MLSLERMICCAGLFVAVSLTGSGAVKADTLPDSGDAVSKLIDQASILKPGYKVSASYQPAQPIIMVVSYRPPGSSERDCKIDALLVSRKIMSKYPGISLVRMRFALSGNPSQYLQYDVTAGDIVGFEKGGLDKSRLLSSLLNRGTSPQKEELAASIRSYKVLDGYALDTRKSMYKIFGLITQYGGEPQELWEKFLAIENKVKGGLDHEIDKSANELNMELHDAYDKTADDYVKTQNLFIAKQVKQLADNFLTYECHPGPFFAERRRVCVAIKLMIREGKNVRYEQSRFITIENEAARNLTEKAKQDILDLESKMNMDSKI